MRKGGGRRKKREMRRTRTGKGRGRRTKPWLLKLWDVLKYFIFNKFISYNKIFRLQKYRVCIRYELGTTDGVIQY